MRFEWDEAKNRLNLMKHGLTFEDATLVFDDPHALSEQDREVGQEDRWQTIGVVGDFLTILIAHLFREQDGEEVIRIISARKATRSERRAYEEG